MRALLLALPALLWATSAAANPEWSADVGIVSDYRFRGIDLSRGRPALQASLSVEDSSGLYGQVWSSTLGHGSDTELDFSGGYDAEISDQLSVNASANLYTYPSGNDTNYVELTGSATFARGPASAKLEMSYVPPQGRTHDNTYVSAEVSYEIPKSAVSLTATLGYERGWFDEVEHGGKLDWSVGAEVPIKPVKFCLTYVGSNADVSDRHALVAAAFVSF